MNWTKTLALSAIVALIVGFASIDLALAKSNGGKCVRAARGYICSGE